MNSRLIGILSSMGVQPPLQGRLYWWQINSLMDEYHERIKFEAQIGGAKLK